MLRKKPKAEDNDLLADKIKALEEEKLRLEQYIQGGAEKELAERINTMPAPDDLESRKREDAFVDQVLSRKEIKNVRRHQAQGTILFLVLLLCIVALASWAYTIYSSQ